MSRKKSKKYSVYSRILAMMLTMVLLLTSSGFQVLAQDMPNDSTVEAAQLEENDAEEPELEEMATTQEETSTSSEDPEETPAPSEDPEATPTPSEDPEETPAPSEDPEATPTPSEDPEATPTPSEIPEVTPTPVEDPEAPAAELKNDQLTFEVESTSVEEGTGLVEIKVHYSLGEDSEESVRTRLYMEGQTNMDFPQFEKSRYTDEAEHSFKLSSNPDEQKYYIQYYVNPGEDFTQTFKMSVSNLKAGESAGFTVRLEVNKNLIPENWNVDDKKYELTYTQTEDGENSSSIWDDLQAGKTVTLTASIGGARTLDKCTVEITQKNNHSYGTTWGNGDGWSTYEYDVVITYPNAKVVKGIAFCVNPADRGPSGAYNQCVVETLDNDLISKICYYAKYWEDKDGFFKTRYPKLNQEDAFIIGHIAAGFVYEGKSKWDTHASTGAITIAKELIAFCEENSYKDFSKKSLNVSEYYKDGEIWRQKSESIKFQADAEQSYTTNLNLGIKAHIGSIIQDGPITVSGNTTFQLSAPLDIFSIGETFTSDVTQSTSFDSGEAYVIKTSAFNDGYGKPLQNLALILAYGVNTSKDINFSVKWNKGATISVNKIDSANPELKLSGAEFTIEYESIAGYSNTDKTVATLITDENGSASLTQMLPPGSYILKETKAPGQSESAVNGYVAADDIKFTISTAGVVSLASGSRSDVSLDGNTFTIKDEKNETSISGTKTWNVPDVFTKPSYIKVQLLRNGNPIYESGSGDSIDAATVASWSVKTVTADDDWEYKWESLPKYPVDGNGIKTGLAYVYTVEEIEVDGTVLTSGNFVLSDGRGEFEPTRDTAEINITNTITGKTEVSGEKIWHDDRDSDGIRPESITIQLLQKDKNDPNATPIVFRTETTTAAKDWKYSFKDLPKYSTDGRTEYEYSVDEKEVPRGYTRRIDGYDIINTHVASTSVWFNGTKELEGRNLQNGEFKFNLYKVTETGEIVEKLQTVTNDAKGVFSFDTIRYTGSGTRYYRITEEKETLGGVTYDETIYDIRVIVSVGGENNDYYTINKYITKVVGSEKTTVDEIRFNNQYHASGEIVIGNIMKTLENSPLAAGQFTFELKDELGNVLQTATNNADGSVTFGALKYTEKDIDKEYTYTVSEVNNHVTGVTYDETVYTVKVKVEDSDPSDGTLKITQETLSGTTPIETMTYKNSFKGSVKLYKTGQDDVVLPNAKFQLYMQNASGEWVLYKVDETTPEEYVTDENGMITVEDLAAGNYYFVETEAPLGYVISKEEDGSSKKYYFTIGIKDGDAGIVENAEVDQEINIENDANPDDTTIAVTKLVTRNGEEFELIDETFYVALFEDEDLTVRVSDVKPIEFKNASASTVYFTGLKFGKSYYVSETDQEGNVIETGVIGEDGVFYVDFAEGNYAEINEGDGTQTIIFENQIITIPRGYYKEGELTITKKLIGADGAAKSSDGVFYAGIFADKEHTQLSDLAEENIVKLDLNGNSSVSKTVKIALHPEEETTLYVTEVDENGKPVADAKDFKYVVTVDGSTVTMDAENTKATVVITNCEEEEEEEESKETEKPKITPTVESQKETKTAVKTGDDTPIAPFAAMLGVSVLAVFLLVLAQKRRKNS